MVNKESFPKLEDVDSRHTSAQNVKSKWPEFYDYLISLNYPQNLRFSEKLYWYFHNITSHPICKECGKPTSYINFTKGYHDFCCISCGKRNKESIEKRRQTCLKKYGVENPNRSDVVKKKIEQTMFERYGVKHALQSKELLQKSQETCEKHYGVKCPSQNHEIVEKQKQTMIEKYGGVGTGSDIVKEKIKQTNLERYDSEWGWGSDEVRKKSLETWRKKYGVENPFAAEEIKEKIKQTCLDKYGVENPGWTEESQFKIRQTNIEKFGTEFPSQTKEVLEKIYKTKKENNTFVTSSIEESFTEWLIKNNIKFERQRHDNIYPFDCDFYFPDTNYYLEIQGNWVHGDHPYDDKSESDKNILQKWIDKNSRYYNTAIETWTVRDPLKRKTAKENNLNWHEVFTTDLDELINECRNLNIF